jgi:RHS repeat-associated protein
VMAQTVYIGLAVSNASTSSLATATFDNVSLTRGTVQPLPVVSSISPILGGLGASITITGSNFGNSQGTNSVSFNGANAASITSWTDTQITATVPNAATTGPLTILVSPLRSNTNVIFTVLNPVITSLSPPSGPVGGSIVVSGSGFFTNLGSGRAFFNGVGSPFTIVTSDTSITATVPPGASSGPLTITIGGVTSAGVQFTVIEPLSVNSISPTLGAVGSSVTISGAGFGATQSDSTVSFNGVSASTTAWSDTQITAVVPSGVPSGPIYVEVAGVIAQGPSFSPTSFLTLTDSKGNQSIYTAVLLRGKWYSYQAQGSGCSTCTERGSMVYTYDAVGNVLSKTDALGHTSTYTYDTNNNVLTQTVPISATNSATTTYTYNSFAEILTSTDPLGAVTTYAYDGNGNLLSVITPPPGNGVSASVTQFAYDARGQLTNITDPLNNITKIAYFPTGLIQTITDAQNNLTTYAYDSHGNRTSVTDALQNQTAFAYDAADRLTTITYPSGGGTTTFSYDIRGRRTSVTDQNGKQTTYAYDDADRLTGITDAANNVTNYGYDTESNLTSIQDANLHSTNFAYDAFGRITSTTFPSTQIETYGYDANNNLTSKTDRKNQLITYTYDQLNRLTQKSYPDTTTVNYTFDNDSRLTQVTDPTGTYQFTFDNMGRLTGTTTQYTFLTGRNFTTAYAHDAASNRTGFTDPENGATAYIYDTLNRLQNLTPPAAISGGRFGFGYDALSRRTSMTRPNAVNSTYSYDNLSRLLSVTHANGGTTLDGASYTVDNVGNRLTRTALPGGTATTFGYDNIYELLSATQSGTPKETYTYDPVGNRLSSLAGSGWSNNTSNQLIARPGITYTYDNNGNTLTKIDSTGTSTYTWDFENRLTSVSLPGTGGIVTFKYDPFGRRIEKTTSSTTSIYAYDGVNLVEETNASGVAVVRYAQTGNMDEPLVILRSSATSYYAADGLGSVTSITNSSGANIATYTYDSFGNLTASTGSLANSLRYTGREFDSETNLHFYRARYYDPQLGRFISEDPIKFYAGVNFYAYALDSPTNWIDSSGFNVSVKLFPGNQPFGHIGLGVNTNDTVGFYPDHDTGASPGHVQPDDPKTEGPPEGCIILITTPKQDQDIQDFINKRRAKPGWWRPGRDCSNFVHDALYVGGIKVDDSTFPRSVFDSLKTLPHTSCPK